MLRQQSPPDEQCPEGGRSTGLLETIQLARSPLQHVVSKHARAERGLGKLLVFWAGKHAEIIAFRRRRQPPTCPVDDGNALSNEKRPSERAVTAFGFAAALNRR
jgi:hypothetical protein